MKPSTLLLAAATTLLVGSTAVAQTVRQGQVQPRPRNVESAAPVEYVIIDSLANALSYYGSNTEPLKYDPLLNVLATIKRGDSTSAQTGNRIYIRASTDLGVSWGPALGPLHDPTAPGSANARYPGLVVNPTHSTNINEFFYYYTAPILIGGAFGGFATGLIDQGGNPIVPPIYSGGIGDGLYGSDARSIETADGQAVVSLQNVGTNHLAVRRLDLSSGTLSEFVPPQFTDAKFAAYIDPQTGDSGRTATTGGIGRDASGAIYAMLWSYTPEYTAGGADGMPVPLISKSTDGGLTWSEMVGPSMQMFSDYAAAEGISSAFTTRYGPTGFVVTGENQASSAFMFYEGDTTITDRKYQIVEVRYDAGAWSITKIADLDGLWYDLDASGGGLDASQTENEIQLVATADGQTIVAKWMEAVGYLITEDINGDGEGDDTLSTTDVFLASRATNGGTWSAKDNATESVVMDRTTWIPTNVLPNDLTRVPMLSVQSSVTSEETIEDQLFNSQRLLVGPQQYLVVTHLDATPVITSAPIAGEATASSITSIMPNPSAGNAVLSINVARSGNGSVELWNAIGERVAVLADGTLEAGTKTFNLNGSSLPVGAYYVAMKIDGQTIAQPFSIVR